MHFITTHWIPVALVTVLCTSAASSVMAQRAARDNAGDTLRAPTQAELRALDSKPAAPVGLRSGKPNPQPVTHADGSVEHELDTSTLMHSVARRNADGSLSTYCVTGADRAESLVNPSKSSARIAAKAAKEQAHDQK